MDATAKEALVGLGAGRGSKLDLLRAKHLTVEKDFTDKPQSDRAAAQAAPAAKPVVVKRPTGLPADVPEVIEIDVGGRQPVWVLATIIRVAGSQLTCQRQDDQSTLKTPLYGRDIVWRVPSLAATPLAA